MNKILKIAQREYLETVKTKAFLIGILITPLLMAGFIFVPKYLTEKAISDQPASHLLVLNMEEELSVDLDSVFAQHNKSDPRRKIIPDFQSPGERELNERIDQLKNDVLNGEIEAFLVIEPGVIEGENGARLYMKIKTGLSLFPAGAVRRLVNNAVTNYRFRQHEISREMLDEIRRWVQVEEVDLGTKSEKKLDRMAMVLVPMFFMMLMFIGIFGTGQGLLNGVIEEKSSRVIEVLLAAVTPFQLMAGKIFGQSAVGFTLVAAYGTVAYIAAVYHGLEGILSPIILLYFIILFVLGFLLFASIFASIGAACNTIKESQNLMGPVFMMLFLPLLAWGYISAHPQATLSIALSLIPPLTPMVMILRIVVYPELPLVEIIGSIALLALTVPVVMWAAAKIFRTGILMYGKPPSLREIIRWVRYG